MFVLQDCSVCFEDYGTDRIPHSIACGHVFCRPCLDSLVSSSSKCPNCRASIGRNAIRKVVCAHQESPTLDAGTLSEAEKIMWQAIESAIESADDYGQRRSLVRDNSMISVRKAGFSRNMLVALDAIRLLVEVEGTNRGLSHHVDAARAMEESLRDRISFLEAQLSGTKANFDTNIQDFRTLVSEVQQLKSSMRIIDETASQITHRLDSPALFPTLPYAHTSPPGHVLTAHGQDMTANSVRSNPIVPEDTSSSDSQLLRRPVLPTPLVEPVNRPWPPVVGPSHLPGTPGTRYPSEPSPARLASGNAQTLHTRVSPPPRWSVNLHALFQGGGSTQVRQDEDPQSIPYSSRFNPSSSTSTSTRTPAERTITAACDYTAEDSSELSLVAGETLKLVYDSAVLDNGSQRVWCRARGIVGLVPRRVMNVV